MLTIACVKQGTLYSAAYVNNLAAMVRRNLTLPHQFVCFTDDMRGIECRQHHIECRVIRDRLEGWWGKLALFAPDTFNDRVLFLDLDTVIVGSLDAIAAYDGPFAILRDFNFADHYGSGVMAWMPSEETTAGIWHSWNAAGRPRPKRGDQAWIEQALRESRFTPDIWQDLFPGAFVSYKLDCFYRPPLPDAKVVCFHGIPKPHECTRAFIKDAWHANDRASQVGTHAA